MCYGKAQEGCRERADGRGRQVRTIRSSLESQTQVKLTQSGGKQGNEDTTEDLRQHKETKGMERDHQYETGSADRRTTALIC